MGEYLLIEEVLRACKRDVYKPINVKEDWDGCE